MISVTQRFSNPLLLVHFLVVALLFLPANSALAVDTRAQIQADAACESVDVVVLIDQSDSMRQTNDPTGKRFDAAATIIDYLGNHSVWLCQGEGIVHRVAVIGFGDDPTQPVGSGSSPLENNPYQDDIEIYIGDQIVPPANDQDLALTDYEAWAIDRDEIKTPIEAASENELGATDHYAALQAAREQFDYWQANPIGDTPRRQSAILITDGEPCLFARGCSADTIYNIGPDMTALLDLTDPLTGAFPWRGADDPQSVYMSLIAMSRRSGSIQERFLADWRTIAQAHGGDVFNANDLNTNLNTIVTDIMGPIAGSAMQPLECNTDIWIYPYTDNLVLLYAFGLEDQTVPTRATITIDAGTNQYQVTGGLTDSGTVPIKEYIADGRNEYYLFQPPLPGRYNITYGGQTDCANLMDIRIQQKSVTGSVVVPGDQASYPAVDPPSSIAAENFRVEVFESGGDDGEQQTHLQEFPDYPLQLRATVTSEDGAYSRVYESFTRLEDGIYESTDAIASPLPGGYQWQLTASVDSPVPDEQPRVVFEDSGRFVATEVIPFGFALTQPSDGALLPLNSVDGPQQLPESIAVTVDLIDSEGLPANIDDLLSDATELFTATMLQGDTVLETIPLTRTPGSTSEFSGQFANAAGGSILTPGDYTIEAQAVWSADRYDPLLYTPAVTTDAIGFSQFEVVPLDLRVTGPDANTTVHENNWLSSLRGEVKPVDFHVEVVNAITGEPVALDDVLADLSSPYQAAIVPPSGNPIIVPLAVLSNENFQRLVAEGAATEVDESGDYQIKLDSTGIALQEDFAWAGQEATYSFTRQDTTFTNPTVWRVIVGLIAAALIALLAFLIYRLTGGPSGRIAVVDTNTTPGREVYSSGLRSSPRVNRLRSRTLEQEGIKVITARRAPRDEDGRRGVLVSAIGTDGEDLGSETLYEGEGLGILPFKEIVYGR